MKRTQFMPAHDAFLKNLQSPAELPVTLSGFALRVTYSADAVAQGRIDEQLAYSQDSFADLAALLALGFLSRPFAAKSPI
jgi:hypothetical protein